MDILSVIIMIAIWTFIGSAAKKAKKRASDVQRPKKTIAQQMEDGAKPGPAPVKPAQKMNGAPAPKAPAPAAKSREAAAREAKARLEKTKGIYTPVTVPNTAPKAAPKHMPEEEHGHTVRPSFEPGAHAHEETSLSGFAPCPPEKTPEKKEPAPAPAAAPVSAPAAAPAFSFAFTKEETLRAILYSEILGKPKALR